MLLLQCFCSLEFEASTDATDGDLERLDRQEQQRLVKFRVTNGFC